MNFQLDQQYLFKPIKRSPPFLAVAIYPDGKYGLSSGLDFVLRKWNLSTGECTHSWDAGGPMNAITIHSKGEWALVSTVTGGLKWDMQRWYFIRSFPTNYGGTSDIVCSEMLGMVIGAGEDSLIYRWDLESGENFKPLTGHHYPVSALAVSEGSNLLMSGDSSGEIRLWELASGESLNAWKGNDDRISDLAVLPRTRRLVSAAWESPIKVWDLDSGEQLQELSGHTGWVKALTVCKHEEWMLSAGDDGLKTWDLEDYQCLHSDDSVDISCLALSMDDKLAISGGQDGSLSIWDLHSADQEMGEP